MAIARMPATIITTLMKIDHPTAFFAISPMLGSLIAVLPRVVVSRRAAADSLYHYWGRFVHIALIRRINSARHCDQQQTYSLISPDASLQPTHLVICLQRCIAYFRNH